MRNAKEDPSKASSKERPLQRRGKHPENKEGALRKTEEEEADLDNQRKLRVCTPTNSSANLALSELTHSEGNICLAAKGRAIREASYRLSVLNMLLVCLPFSSIFGLVEILCFDHDISQITKRTSEWNKPIPARRLPNGECCEGYLPFSEGALIRWQRLQFELQYQVLLAQSTLPVSSSIGSIHSSSSQP